MEKLVKEGFFNIVRKSINTDNNQEKVSELSLVELNKIIYIAYNNKFIPIIHKTLIEDYGDIIPIEIKEDLNILTKHDVLLESSKTFALHMVLKRAKEEKQDITIFKGPVLADLYPEYLKRISGDTDIFVFEKDRESFLKILSELGYVKDFEKSKETVPVYYNDLKGHKIEVHYCLWEDFKGPQMRILEEMNLLTMDNRIKVNACKMTFETMEHTRHLIYQIFHIVKHFATQSVSVRYMADITLFVNKYKDLINWEEFYNEIKKLGYEKFTITFLSLCKEYLFMDLEIPTDLEITEEDREILVSDMLNHGMNDGKASENWQVLGLITPYIQGEGKLKKSGFKRKLSIIFPAPNELPDKCSYAKKHKFLLPIAWIHKFSGWTYRYLLHKYSKKSKKNTVMYSAFEKIEAADKRLLLMEKLGLIK